MARARGAQGRVRRGRVLTRSAKTTVPHPARTESSASSISEDELEIDLESGEQDQEQESPRKKVKQRLQAAESIPGPKSQETSTSRQQQAWDVTENTADAALEALPGNKDAGAAKPDSRTHTRQSDEAQDIPEAPSTPEATCLPEVSPEQHVAEQAQQGWSVAEGFLRSRLQDPTSSASASMPLRPSLQRLKASLVTKLTAAIQVPGDNASLLIIGPSGSGKSMVLHQSIAELQTRINTNPDNPQIGVVRLSGLVQAEDRAAFQEIARQLCMAFKCHFVRQATQADNVDFLRDMLKELSKGSKAVLFVLDHFERLAARSKQAVLYTLLDCLQAANMQAAVVGVTCRLDAIELMEKRVRSRFSHEKELVLNPQPDSTVAQDSPAGVLQALLQLPPDVGVALPYVLRSNAAVAEALEQPGVQAALQSLVLKGLGSPRDLVEVALQAVWSMSGTDTILSAGHLTIAMHAVAGHANGMVATVAGLAVLELYLVAAVHRRCKAAGVEACNFEMAWAELAILRRQGSGCLDVQSRPAALRAFDRLIARGILHVLDPRVAERGGQREFMWVTLVLSDSEIRDGAHQHPGCPALLTAWLTKSAGAVRSMAEAV